MRIPKRLVLACIALALFATGWWFASQTPEPDAADDTPTDFPPPRPPGPAADLRMGAVVLTNEASWGLLLDRGRPAGGAIVLEVLPDSAAHAAGLRVGDVISGLDDDEISNHEQLLVSLRNSSINRHVLRVVRPDESREELEVELMPPGTFSLLSHLESQFAADPQPVTQYLLGEVLPDATRAIDLLRGLLADQPQFAEGHALLARRLMERLEQAPLGGDIPDAPPDLRDAMTALETAIALSPDSSSLYQTRSQLLLSLGDPAEAETDAIRALELDDASAEARFLLGTARLSLGRDDEAISDLHRAVELNPYVFDYYVNLALCYRSLDRESDARATLLAARDLASEPGMRQQLDELMDGDGNSANLD